MKFSVFFLLLSAALMHGANAFGKFGQKARDHRSRHDKVAREEAVKFEKRGNSSEYRFLTNKTLRRLFIPHLTPTHANSLKRIRLILYPTFHFQ